jgi:hypothetical protein
MLNVEMKTLHLGVFALSVLVFVFSKYIPTAVLKLITTNYVGVVVVLAAVLLSACYDMILTLAILLAVGSLFLESRKRVLMNLVPLKSDKLDNTLDGAPVSAITKGADDLIEGEVHPEHEEPDVESYKFEPTKDASDEFSPVGESIDNKHPLETASANSNRELAEHLTRQGVV